MTATAEALQSVEPGPAVRTSQFNARSPYLVFNKDTSALNTAGSNLICDAYGHIAGTAANHGNVVPQAVPPEATGLLLFWILATKDGAVTALGTQPEFMVAGRIHKPVVPAGTLLQPKDASDYDADMAILDTNGLWVACGQNDPAGQTGNWWAPAVALSDPNLAGTILMTSGTWTVYSIPLAPAVTGVVTGRAAAVRHVDTIHVYTSILAAYTAVGASDSAQMVVGAFV